LHGVKNALVFEGRTTHSWMCLGKKILKIGTALLRFFLSWQDWTNSPWIWSKIFVLSSGAILTEAELESETVNNSKKKTKKNKKKTKN
jgi:hypothetical protein